MDDENVLRNQLTHEHKEAARFNGQFQDRVDSHGHADALIPFDANAHWADRKKIFVWTGVDSMPPAEAFRPIGSGTTPTGERMIYGVVEKEDMPTIQAFLRFGRREGLFFQVVLRGLGEPSAPPSAPSPPLGGGQ